jgi:hypothetical protein
VKDPGKRAQALPAVAAFGVLAGAVGAWMVILTMGHAIAWDEVEFFRATDWVRQGLVPYRDFWEHHFPLQWLLMALPSRWARGGGTGAIIFMRWAQVPFWLLTGRALCLWMKPVATAAWVRVLVLGLLFSCAFFSITAIEYRQETLSSCFFLCALLVLDRPTAEARTRFGGGCLLGLAVLANMRMGPLAVLAGVLYLATGADGKGWGWNPRALWTLAGGAATGLLAATAMLATGSLGAFWRDCVSENRMANLMGVYSKDLLHVLALPLAWPDLPALLFGALALRGLWLALAQLKAGGPAQRAAILVLFQFVQLVRMPSTYLYYFQMVMLSACPLVALALTDWDARRPGTSRVGWRCGAAGGVLLLALLDAFVCYDLPGNQATLKYQNCIMDQINERTQAGDKIWDTCGYAFRRQASFSRWFIPAHIRLAIRKGLLAAYTPAQMRADPPAAVLVTGRTYSYLAEHPDLRWYLVTHYLPVDLNLWMPGLTTVVGAGQGPLTWTVPASGRYRIYASEALLRHPWFRDPVACAFATGPGARALEVPLDRIPDQVDATILWHRNGIPVVPAGETLLLNRGDLLVASSAASTPRGVFLVPAGTHLLFHVPMANAPAFDPDLLPPGMAWIQDVF